MPKGFTPGPRTIHPRWGWRISEETTRGLDLEVAVLWYAFVCTAAEEQIDPSRVIFLEWATRLAEERGQALEPLSPVELITTHVRNEIDGTCTVRVGKRLSWSLLAP